jgi:hypothetical protein
MPSRAASVLCVGQQVNKFAHFVGRLVPDTSQAMRPVSHPSVIKVGSAPLDNLRAKLQFCVIVLAFRLRIGPVTLRVAVLAPAPLGNIPRNLLVLSEKLENGVR